MKRLFFLFFLFSALSAGAQIITYDTIRVSPDQTATFDKSKLRFGANLGLSISRNYTNLGFERR